MAKSKNNSASAVSITITASTDNPHDKGYHHCFEQSDNAILIFEIDTDKSVNTINFALWNLRDPVNPSMVEPATDWPVTKGHVEIRISHYLDQHLGPGPYCAALTATSATDVSAESKSAKRVGNALHYYETWKGSRKCKY